ncbi:YhgE/Pip domain-containing protein [Galactobacter caseinivorans]|uniref:YhgE/Pip domain-containing protein n=1 Tax=Galactobacter caseinivorans TaxID=2676123 RepID=A0A496PHT0_9MICC|nr:YhgE/Pip domain-containing protein [Galactobacter caseinivorans]RKW70043.1 YhgE/Pip domain-containing protein [Galactobacter caseinivorans]
MARITDWLKSHFKLMISLVGVACIPLVYCGALIFANSDPTGHLNQVPALVVNLDSAAKTSTGESVDLGPSIVEELEDSEDNNNLKWQESSEEDANRALAKGDALAVLTIPEGFSAAAASAGDDNPQKAHAGQLEVRTNDASNYLMGTIGRTVGKEVTSSVRTKVSENYLKNIYVGFTDIHSSISDASDGAAKLADGTEKADGGAGKLVVGLNKLKDGSAKVDSGAVKLASGATTLSTGANKLASGLGQLEDKTKDLPAQAKALNDGAQKIAAGTKTLDDSAGKLSDGAKTLYDGTKTLDSSAKQLNDGAQKVAAGNQKLNKTAQGISTSVTEISDAVQETLGSLGTLVEDTTGISSATKVDVSGRAEAANDNMQKILDNPQVAAAVKAAGLEERAATVKKDLSDVSDGAAKTDAAIKKAQKSAGIVGSKDGVSIDELQAKAKKVSGAAKTFSDSTQQLSDGATQVAAGTSKLSKSTPTLKNGAKQLSDGTNKLAKATPTLKDGSAQLAAGTKKLNAAVPTLSKAIASAADGGNELAKGAKKLATGATTLSTGTGDLAKGTSDADKGAGDLKDGLVELNDGATKLDDGLADGVKEIPDYTKKDQEHLSTVNSEPVSMDDASVNKMANYGTGLSPYFISLALWIGGIALFMLMAPLPRKLLDRHLPAPITALRAYLPSAIMAVVQASIVSAIVLFGLQLDVANPLGLWGLAVFASLTFVAVNQGLVSLLGAPGRFLSLILVVLQIASAGGTYPWQTMPEIFKAVRPYLPMTYTVEAFRSLVAGGDPIGLSSAYGVLGCWMVGGLIFLTIAAIISRKSEVLRDWATLAPGMPGGGRGLESENAASADAEPAQRSERELVGAGVGAGAGVGTSAGAASTAQMPDAAGSGPRHAAGGAAVASATAAQASAGHAAGAHSDPAEQDEDALDQDAQDQDAADEGAQDRDAAGEGAEDEAREPVGAWTVADFGGSEPDEADDVDEADEASTDPAHAEDATEPHGVEQETAAQEATGQDDASEDDDTVVRTDSERDPRNGSPEHGA